MISWISQTITNIASHGSSFLSGFYGDYLSASGTNILNMVMDWIVKCIWNVISLVMFVMDMLEYIAFSFLGIDMGINDFTAISKQIDLNSLLNTFKAILGLSILLIIIFTIIAIVKQEWSNAANGLSQTGKDGKAQVTNSKSQFISKMLRSIMFMFIMPLLVYFMFAGVTSVLNSFNTALKQVSNSTVASQVVASSTYEANKYRMYALNDQRIPIIIKAYEDAGINYDNLNEAAIKIQSVEVQQNLRKIANNFNDKSFDKFADTIVKQNNNFYNSNSYSQLYEQFICTAEQYQVMADFVDYAQQSNITYYIKSIDDDNIEWKYVSSAVFKSNSKELTIEYMDANVVNNGMTASAANVTKDKTFSITYTPSTSITSPISDALESIMAMLGLDKYGDNLYNVMEREEGFNNVVTWANEKALLQFSNDFNINDRNTWTDTDEIIVYEYYRWKYNNSLRDYTIDDIKKGIELDVKLITYQEYIGALDIYSKDRYLYVIELNKNYYIVEKSHELTDKFGNAYYTLISYENEEMSFLQKAYTTIKEDGSVTLKLSNAFDINDIETWTKQDQILVYEYFEDDTYNNALRRYSFSEFKNGVNLNKFLIKNYDENGDLKSTEKCVLINKTYYKLNNANLIDSNNNLLKWLKDNISYIYYNYKININNQGATGFNNLDSYVKTGAVNSFEDLDLTNEADKKYENYRIKFSSNFSYNDLFTWSYRDILVFYLLCKGYADDISYVKKHGIIGDVGKFDDKYVVKLKTTDDGQFKYVYINDVESISTNGIYKLDLEKTLADNIFSSSHGDAILYLDPSSEKIITANAGTYHFEFSDNFIANDTTTWTIEDFVLVYASQLGLLDSISNIKITGYDALIFVKNNKTYYRFGKDTQNAYFLCLDNNTNIEYFINKSLSSQNGFDDYKDILFETNAADNYNASEICSSWFVKNNIGIVDYATGSALTETIYYSGNFEASNVSSWTQADFLLYYLGTTNFKVGHLYSENQYGSSQITKVLFNEGSNLCLNYATFELLKNRKLASYTYMDMDSTTSIIDTTEVKYETSLDEQVSTGQTFTYKVATSSGIESFKWTNYFYFNKGNDTEAILNNITNVSENVITKIDNLDFELSDIFSINLRLSYFQNNANITDEGIKYFLKNPNTWTVVDYIVLNEFSKQTKNGDYDGMTFDDLCKFDNFVNVYSINEINAEGIKTTHLYIETNGGYYNLTDYIVPDNTNGNIYVCKQDSKIGLTGSNISDYFIKIPYKDMVFSVNPTIKYNINQTEYTIAYESENNGEKLINYITPHIGTKIAYQKDLDSFDRYSIGLLTRKVSWPQKLMNDMQVLYPDLNWNTLIANGEWMDVLGDYVSANTNGIFVSEGNSSNITAVGMVLSEFFLSCADTSILNYADYEYSSLFDENIIKSLMLSTLGEDAYLQLSMQANIFVELFNTTFASILDDIAADQNINIKESGNINLSVFVYKAFLATQILSSDMGEYFYTVANRVYAQYTIYESLASAVGKYAEYDKYINGEQESIILQIGTEYYDVTSFIELIDIKDRFSCNDDIEPPSINSIIKQTDSQEFEKLISSAFSSYELILKEGSSNSDDSNIVYCGANYNKLLYNIVINEDLLTELRRDDGLFVQIYNIQSQNKNYIFLKLNNQYYDITEYIIDNGYYKITSNYKQFINSSASTGENLVEKIFDSSEFLASSFATIESQSRNNPDYLLKVEFSDNYSDNNLMTVLDKIIKDYVDAMKKDLTGTYRDKDYGYASGFDNNPDNYSIIANIYVIDNENAFTYASFEDLVLYENKALIIKNNDGQYEINLNATPMFTFNIARIYNIIENERHGVKYTNGESWQKFAQKDAYRDYWNESFKTDTVTALYEKLKLQYKIIFDTTLDYYELYSSILDDDPYYCYMFEVYTSIARECLRKNEDYPTYLNVYIKYLNGDITRWNILSKEDITASSQYIPNYDTYNSSLLPAQIKCIFGFASLFKNQISFTGDLIEETKENVASGSSVFEIIGDTLGDISNSIENFSPQDIANKSGLANTENSLFNDYQNVFGIFDATTLIGGFFQKLDKLGLGLSYSAKMTELFIRSSAGDRDAWSVILKLYNSLGKIIDEFNAIKELYTTGEVTTEKGSKIADGYSEETYDKALNTMISFYEKIQEYVLLQQKVDITIKSCITFTLAQYGKNYTTNYKFNLENRGYTFSTVASPLRLAEYTLGGAFLTKYGIYPAFTDAEFEGFIHTSKVYDSVTGIMKTKLDMWSELKQFAGEIVKYSAQLYYTTSLGDLAQNVENAIKINDILLDKNGNNATTIEYMILEYLADTDIKPQLLCSLMLDNTDIAAENEAARNIMSKINMIIMNEESNASINNRPTTVESITKDDVNTLLGVLKNAGFDKVHIAFDNIISYLILSEEQVEDGAVENVSFDNMTFSDLKVLLINRLVDYVANPSEKADENVNRYLALFNLICSDIKYYNNGQYKGTNLKPVDVYGKLSVDTTVQSYAGGENILHFANYGENGERLEGGVVSAELSLGTGNKNVLLELANCDNRPLEKLVELEYENLYNRTDGFYDEALGDVFVVCLYDEQLNKYIPIMAKNSQAAANNDFYDYVDKYHHFINTDYYPATGRAYPIVAKGMITSNGLPTAIRIVDGEVMFYRTNITATANVDDSAILNSAFTSEITTIGYTSYVPATFYLPFGDTNKMVEFVGSVNIGTVLKSDLKVFFLQTNNIYKPGAVDEFGGLIVVENMAIYYQLGMFSIFMMFMGFVVLIPLMFRLSLSAMRRILDLILLCLAYPLILSFSPLKDVSSNWNDMMKKALLSVFGYIIGFNCYYILVTSVLNIDFVNADTLENIKSIGGFGFVSLPILNMIVRYLFIIEAVAIIKGAMDLLLPMVTAGTATNTTAPATGGKDILTEVKSVTDDTKKVLKQAGDIYSGKFLSQAKDAAVEYLKTMVPGSTIMGAIKEDVQDITSKHKAKSIKEKAIESGLSPAVADSFAKKYYENQKKQREQKRKMHIDNANAFIQTYAKEGNYKFETTSTLRSEVIKKFGKTSQKKPSDKGDKKAKKSKK